MNRYKLLHINKINNKVLLVGNYSQYTAQYIQLNILIDNGKNMKKICIFICTCV